MTTVQDLPRIHAQALAVRADRKRLRTTPPFVRLWDGNWGLQGVASMAISGEFKWLLNDTGAGTLTLPDPSTCPLAAWATTRYGKTPQNVHITVDKNGARWSGRLKQAVVKQDDRGITIVELQFLHDMEELKHICVWSNPFLPAFIQFPRDFLLAGPSIWTLKTALFLNVARLAGMGDWVVPDDPLSKDSLGNLDQSTWPIVVAPTDFFDDGSLWTIVGSRFKMWFHMAQDTLDYAQLSVICRRWLHGDPAPWPGANLRSGTLVVDIVDQSGFYSGTSKGGNVLTGLEYTIEVVTNDFLDNQDNVIADPNDPSQYVNPGWIGTLPFAPWVIYRPELHTGVQTSEFTILPFTDVQVITGGKSLPGVNEAISLAIEGAIWLIGDALSAIPFLEGAGAIADQVATIAVTVLSPFYDDTLLAWWVWQDGLRIQQAGWSHYLEHVCSTSDQAYTLSSLLNLTTGMWATRAFFNHKLTVQDGQPYYIGDQGQGDFFIGDRVGSTVRGMPRGEIYVDQVTQLDLKWDRKTTPTWDIQIGSNKEVEEPMLKGLRMLQDAVQSIEDIGFL